MYKINFVKLKFALKSRFKFQPHLTRQEALKNKNAYSYKLIYYYDSTSMSDTFIHNFKMSVNTSLLTVS